MIVKDLEHIEPVGKLEQAGYYAESQLALCDLRRSRENS